MIISMTAFASAEYFQNGITATVEIRGYNSRYLDLLVRMPASFGALEEPVKQMVSARVQRGRLEIRIGIRTEAGETERFAVNEELADAYFRALEQLRQRYQLSDPVSLEHLARFNGIIETAETEIAPEAVGEVLRTAVAAALDDLVRMRENEGRSLAADLAGRIDLLESWISSIEQQTEGLLEQYQQRLKERIAALTRGLVEIDPARIAQEAAFLAERSDISEELVRAKSHMAQFRELMASPEPAGKPLNFLLQEFTREFNTMGSKAGSADISHIIVSAKSELEKLREQVQNIE